MRDRRRGLPHVGAVEVAPHDAQHAQLAEAPQHLLHRLLIFGAGEAGSETLSELGDRQGALQLATLEQLGQQFRAAAQRLQREVGKRDQTSQLAALTLIEGQKGRKR